MQRHLEKTIEFNKQEEALAILGYNDEYLKILSDSFDSKIISRGDKVVVRGNNNEVLSIEKVLMELLNLYRNTGELTSHDVKYCIELIKKGEQELLNKVFNNVVLVTAKGKQVKPKTVGQSIYLEAIKKNYITFGIGPAGTGKTYLAVVMAVIALKNKEVEKIILTRPAVEAGERLGFLPGDLQEKVDPYLRPLYDALYDILGVETFQKFMAKNIIEVAPLAYMRGRTLENSFVILDEAQNTTTQQMKMFLTRLGFGSKMVITGDLSQTDLPQGTISGLAEAKYVLHQVEGIKTIMFDDADVIRHEVVARIIRAYQQYDNN
ncbi:MAG: PhoH family protein [Negativicutes bacterium]|nr:PhoH family protein [Negativicutes bacterium]MBP8629899.1 PhoH family protein [Negativicutes bacterium]MBP9537682.1 PhoH family protein [Negativicutes bacterium]MBP9949044.1 PhoH family protein [Negativicutes bacterium]